MEYKCFRVELIGRVAHVQLSRPEKRNAMSPAFWDELPAIIQEIDGDSLARAIVISSTGPHFSAGLDLQAFDLGSSESKADDEASRFGARTRAAQLYDDIQRLQRSFSCLEEARIPVLAAIQGGAIGAGLDLVTACDMRYAAEDAFFCIQEINLAMTADVGTFPRLVKLIPEGIVRELAYTGRRMPATEAQAAGLVNRVFPDHDALVAGVLDIAREIAAKAPLAVYGSKRIINYARDHSTQDGLDSIGIWNASFLQPEEIAESIRANAEKRPGRFADLPPIRRKQTTSQSD